MPSPAKGAKILVTGASGYIASWICLYLLQAGYTVRGTTRNEEKGQWMKDMYKKRGHDKFEFCIVSDLENENAFGEAVKAVDAIIHTASPFHWDVNKPEDFIVPAVAGTKSILRAAAQEKVQRLVLTSSYASILEQRDPGTVTFTEADWNQQSIDEVNENGVDAWRMHWYRASKTLAERAAWEFVDQEHPSFDLVTICPPYVLGPIIHQAATPDSLNVSAKNWFSYLVGEKTTEDAIAPAGILCDVRDVARCHVKALELPEAAGKRIGIATRTFTIQTLLDHVLAPENVNLVEAFPNIVRGNPGAKVPPINWFDCSASLKLLDIQPTDDRSTAIDMTESLLERHKEWQAASKPKVNGVH